MVLIGFVLMAAAAVVGVDIAAQNDFAIDIDAFGHLFSTSASGVFVVGAVTGLAAAGGMLLFRDGLIRANRARSERHAVMAERERMAAAYAREHGIERREGEPLEIDLRDRELEPERVTTF